MSTIGRVSRTAIIVAVILGFSGGPAQANYRTTLYVSPDGSDSARGTARDPLRTPQLAVDRLGRRGGTVRLASGRYPRRRIVIDGRFHVTVRAAAGAVLDGAGLK